MASIQEDSGETAAYTVGYTTSLGYTPTFTIAKGGEEITGIFADRILSIRVASCEGNGDVGTVDIDLDDRDWAIAEPSIGEGSVTLEVSLGYVEGALYEMGTFQVDEITHKGAKKIIALHGNSIGFNTNLKAPIITSYEGKTLGEIVGQIAKSANVKASVDPSLSSFTIPYLNQYCGSGHMLNELERRFDATANFSDGYLAFVKRGSGTSVAGADLGTVTLYPEDLSDWLIKSNNYFAYSKVRASYLDRVKNQLVWIESTVKGSPNSTVPYMFDQPFGSQAEAQAAANAHMARLNRSTKQGIVTLSKGCPEIRGASKVILSGFRSGIDDTYVVRCATHSLTKDGGLGTSLDLYTDDGADASDSNSTGNAPSTAPSLDEMTAGTTVPLGQGGIGHR